MRHNMKNALKIHLRVMIWLFRLSCQQRFRLWRHFVITGAQRIRAGHAHKSRITACKHNHVFGESWVNDGIQGRCCFDEKLLLHLRLIYSICWCLELCTWRCGKSFPHVTAQSLICEETLYRGAFSSRKKGYKSFVVLFGSLFPNTGDNEWNSIIEEVKVTILGFS